LDAISPEDDSSSHIEQLKSTSKSPEILEAFEIAKNGIHEFYRKDYEILGYPIP